MNKRRRFLHRRLARCALSIALAAMASPVALCDVSAGEISPLPPLQRVASRRDAWEHDRLFEPPLQRAGYRDVFPGATGSLPALAGTWHRRLAGETQAGRLRHKGGQAVQGSQIQPLNYTPAELDRPLLEFDPLEQSLEGADPPGSKPGIFQTIRFSETFLPQPNFDDLGLNEWELSATFGFPLPTRQSPLLITPGFKQTLLDGPTLADLPANVYDVTVQFLWMHQLTDRWGIQLGVTPGVHSDFERGDSDSLRIAGRGIGVYQWREDVKVVLGVVYLDRNDVSLLPAAGIIWTPHEDIRWELVAPRPRVAWRFSCDDCIEQWAYLAGEFGGGEWSIVRAGGASDVATYRDFRILAGLERKPLGAYGMHLTFEFGYVFARELEYASLTPDLSLDDTGIVRLTLSY